MDVDWVKLAEPFPAEEVDFKPQAVKGNRAMAVAYIDARTVEDRLDAVLGPPNWKDEYIPMPDGNVVCTLSVRVGGEWVPKTDTGSPSEQPDGGDRVKAAFSDALKRAAVKWGIGRYLYYLDNAWADYDPAKRSFVAKPRLPGWALPGGSGRPHKAPATTKPTTAVPTESRQIPREQAGSAPAATTPVTTAPAKPAAALPATGEELHRRLREYDAKSAAGGVWKAGSLLAFVAAEGAKAGYGEDIAAWSGPAIEFAVEAVKVFEATTRARAAKA